MALMYPLHIISLELLNPKDVRAFAIKQLLRIETTLGIRQTGLVAREAAQHLDCSHEDETSSMCIPSIQLPLMLP